MLCNIFLHSV
ncbi:hypothetical protein YPPY54_1832, partial [Yersinia pestis PY-54]